MTRVEKPRYGDRSARRFGLSRGATVLVVVLAVLFLIPGSVALTRWIQAGDGRHVLGSAIGIALVILIAGGLAVGWLMYWRKLARSLRIVRELHPKSLVVGARLPNVGAELLAKIWPSQWGAIPAPQQVALRIDASGVALFRTSTPPSSLVELTWAQVKNIVPVEYVEGGRAYEGLAIEGARDGAAIVLQIVTPSPFVRFPVGKALAKVAIRANEQRPDGQ